MILHHVKYIEYIQVGKKLFTLFTGHIMVYPFIVRTVLKTLAHH